MNVMNRMHAIRMKSLIVAAPHGVVSNTPLRVVHKSLNGILIVMGPARLLQSVGT